MVVTFFVGHFMGHFGIFFFSDRKKIKEGNVAPKLPFQKEIDPTKKIWLDWENEFKSMRKRHTLILVNDYKPKSGQSFFSLCLYEDGQLKCNHDFSETYLASLGGSHWRKPWELTEEQQIRVAKLYPALKQKVKEYYEKTPTKEDLLDSMLAQYEKAAEIYIQQ